MAAPLVITQPFLINAGTGGTGLTTAQAQQLSDNATAINQLPQVYDAGNNYTYPSQIAAGGMVLHLKAGQAATGAYDANKWEAAPGGTDANTIFQEPQIQNIPDGLITPDFEVDAADLTDISGVFAFDENDIHIDLGDYTISGTKLILNLTEAYNNARIILLGTK